MCVCVCVRACVCQKSVHRLMHTNFVCETAHSHTHDCVCIETYMYVHIMQTCIHTWPMRMHKHMIMHVPVYTCICKHMHTSLGAYIQALKTETAYTHTHMIIHEMIHTSICTHVHALHTYTHTHTHMYIEQHTVCGFFR